MSDEDEALPVWLRPRFDASAARARAGQLQRGLRVLGITPVGFPYALYRFAWTHRRWGRSRHESLLCVVDRCQGVSASLETAELSPAPEDMIRPVPRFGLEELTNIARRQALQIKYGRLRRRGALGLIESRAVLKPLWRVEASLPRHGSVRLLIDGLSGGYHVLEEGICSDTAHTSSGDEA